VIEWVSIRDPKRRAIEKAKYEAEHPLPPVELFPPILAERGPRPHQIRKSSAGQTVYGEHFYSLAAHGNSKAFISLLISASIPPLHNCSVTVTEREAIVIGPYGNRAVFRLRGSRGENQFEYELFRKKENVKRET
jgi:hypothetical protein